MITMADDAAIPTALADRIKRARLKAKLSQDDLAALASISRRPIYVLESGRGSIRLDTLIRILDALGLVLEVRPRGPES